MDRDALVNALRRSDAASQACSAALARGADFEVFEVPTSATELVTIFRRRKGHVARVGVEHGGFDEALADLEACGAAALRLGQVVNRAEQRHYQIFLSADADDVIACLWVHHDV